MADEFKIDIKLKLQDLGKDIQSLGEKVAKDLQKAVQQTSKMVYNEGLRLASERNKQSYNIYVNNLKYEKMGDNIYVIYLVESSEARFFEDGWSPYDMKPGFLKSTKAKTTKDGKGKYFDVPFNIEPKAKTGAGKRITDMRSAVDSVLKDETVSKRVQEFNENSSGMNKFGKTTTYTGTQDPSVEGLVEVEKAGSKRYFLFRRVSTKSDASKWIHAGFKGVHIFADLEKYADDQIDKLIETLVG